jgi:hypothetical protein
MRDYFVYNWCTREDRSSGGGSSGGGGGDGNGCGIMFVLFLFCMYLSGTCNKSDGNNHYLRPSSPQIESVEDVDHAPLPHIERLTTPVMQSLPQ